MICYVKITRFLCQYFFYKKDIYIHLKYHTHSPSGLVRFPIFILYCSYNNILYKLLVRVYMTILYLH